MMGIVMQSRMLILAACAALAGFAGPRPYVNAPAQPQPVAAPTVSAAPIVAPAEMRGEDSREAMVASALNALSAKVSRLSNEGALRTAFQAYYSFKAAHPEQVKKPYLYFVDYGLNNRTPRGYVFNMDDLTLVEGPFMVAHGRGSSKTKNAVPTRFSNRSGGAATSLGVYVTQESYAFSGHAGGLYHSIGLRLNGVSGRFNDRARARGVVMHGAPYVTSSGSGRSEGCPAVDQARAHRLIPKLANGSVVVLYSPRDNTWLQQDPWINSTSLAAN